MDRTVAEYLVRSLIGRLDRVGQGYVLPKGIFSQEEVDALKQLAGIGDRDEKEATPEAVRTPAIRAHASPLNLECLEGCSNEETFVCLDFGTAFSKAAVWQQYDEDPVPLELTRTASGAAGFVASSCSYIADDHMLFGANAASRFERDNNEDRELFDSPKQYLTHSFEDLDSPAKAAIDPTRSFRTRELLTLYLGYLSAIASDQLEAGGFERYTKRRFAVPGWGDAQIDSKSETGPAARLGGLFLEAQILADNISLDEWRDGVPVNRAREILDRLAATLPERRQDSRFAAQPVLEAIAASAAVQERYQNQRPQLLVIDIGAGTTDIGIFKLSTPENGPALAFPYRSGLSAMPKAGNVVDNALVTEISRALGLSAGSELAEIYQRKLRRRARDLKVELFTRGVIKVDVDDFDTIEIDLDQFVASDRIKSFARGFTEKIVGTLNRAGIGSANFTEARDENLVVFTGGGSKLPFLTGIFDEPLKLETGSVKFALASSEPAWLESFDPDFRTVFPQLAVATGGAAPYLPDQKSQVGDTRRAGERRVNYFTG